MKKSLFPLVISALLLTSCVNGKSSNQSGSNSSSSGENDLVFNDLTLDVYQDYDNQIKATNAEDDETFTYSFSGEGIRIEHDKVIALKGDTETVINVTSSKGRNGKFTAKVNNSEYISKHEATEKSEGWFNDVSVKKINSMTDDFANGIDISSCKQLYDKGQKFYNKDGVEQSLFYILKDAGVNWVRLRLWHTPYDTWEENGETKYYYYGGGNCDINNVTWMAHEAKAAGLKVLLDIHYSDFWSDPNNQIVPKAWVDINTVSGMAKAISDYTAESINHLKENNALPDMVSIGNETYGGMLMHNPGGITKTGRNNAGPYYSVDHTERTDGTQARWNFTNDKSQNYNIRTYFKAGVDAVKAVDKNILTMIHFVKGFSNPDLSITFFQTFDDLDIDVYGLSGYSYWHYSNMSTLKTGFSKIAAAFPNKQIAIAETSYGFTYETDNWASNTFSLNNETCKPVSGYPCSIQGQASMLRDTTEVISDISNGFGVFYWEGAWTPTKQSGWADYTSKASWSNQGFFSYNGKSLGSLEVYNKMKG